MGSVRERYSRNVIPSEAEGFFSLAIRGSVPDSEKWETPYREKVGAVLPVNGLAKEEGKRGRKRFLAALEMTVWGNGYPLYRIKCALGKSSSCITISRYARNDRVENEYPVHHAKKECVGNAFFSYRHRKRSRGIFFVDDKRERVWQREMGNTVSQERRGRCFP